MQFYYNIFSSWELQGKSENLKAYFREYMHAVGADDSYNCWMSFVGGKKVIQLWKQS